MRKRSVIFKYPLNQEINQLHLPTGSKILCVQPQNNIPTLWIMHNVSAVGNELRTFSLIATGEIFFRSELDSYIGTVQINGLVWHVIEFI